MSQAFERGQEIMRGLNNKGNKLHMHTRVFKNKSLYILKYYTYKLTRH